MKQWIDKLRQERTLTPEEFRQLLTGCDAEILRYINKQAQEVALLHFGNKIYIRGLIEISNCCRNNCYYCGIRKGNPNIERYRLSRESILNCCKQGYELGFRTFVLQGGVMGAVKAYLKEEAEKINAIQVSDINKKNIALLRACAKTGKAAGQFIEVMACEGGCITGPSTHNDIVSGRRQLAQELLKRKESYETMDR